MRRLRRHSKIRKILPRMSQNIALKAVASHTNLQGHTGHQGHIDHTGLVDLRGAIALGQVMPQKGPIYLASQKEVRK